MRAHEAPAGSRPWLAALSLVLLVGAAYLPATQCGFIWDDDDYVVENSTLRTVDGLRRIWCEIGAIPQYYPMVHTSFWLEFQLFELDARGYHLSNILLHALGAVLLHRVLAFLRVPGAWLGAALFALHPVQVESVAWITERKNVLSGAFYFGAALSYLTYALPRPDGAGPGRGRRRYLAAAALFLAALLSKTVTCSLPAALLLVLWWKRGRLLRSDLKALAPFFLVGLALALLTVWMERDVVGAAGEEWSLSLLERCLIAGRAVWFYAAKLVWPADLSFIYPRWDIEAGNPRLFAYPVALLLVIGVLWWGRYRIGRAPLVAALLFVGTLFPALSFFDVYPMRYSFVADHFQYLASAGLLAAAGAGIYRTLQHAGPRIRIPLAAVLLAGLGTLTALQTRHYEDLESLWRDTLQKNPTAWIAHNNLGNLLLARGEEEEAIRYYRQSLEIRPDYDSGHYNLGRALQSQGRLDQALLHYRRALEVNPAFVDARNNLAAILLLKGAWPQAARQLRELLRIKPDHADAHFNLGTALAAQSHPAQARQHFRRAVELRPDFPEANTMLGWELLREGDLEAATRHFSAAQRARPDFPLAQAGSAWVLATHPDSRRRDATRAVALAESAAEATRRRNPRVLDALAAAYAEAGRFGEATATAQQALELYRARGSEEVTELQERLQLYTQRRPYHEPAER